MLISTLAFLSNLYTVWWLKLARHRIRAMIQKQSVHRLVIETTKWKKRFVPRWWKQSVHRLVIETFSTISWYSLIFLKAICTPFGDWNRPLTISAYLIPKAICTPFGDWNDLNVYTNFFWASAICTPFGDWNLSYVDRVRALVKKQPVHH